MKAQASGKLGWQLEMILDYSKQIIAGLKIHFRIRFSRVSRVSIDALVNRKFWGGDLKGQTE